MASATMTSPTIAPWSWPPRLSSTWPPSPELAYGPGRQPGTNTPTATYFMLALIRVGMTFMGFIFLSPFQESLPRVAVILAFLLIFPEVLTARQSLSASDMGAKRAWTIANLAFFVAGLLLLVVGLVAPASHPPFFDKDDKGSPAPLIVRAPTIWAILFAVGAGFTLPAVRVRNWRRGMDRGVDEFPGIDAPVYYPATTGAAVGLEGLADGPPALEQPYTDEPDARRKGLAAADQENGALADVFALQNNV